MIADRWRVVAAWQTYTVGKGGQVYKNPCLVSFRPKWRENAHGCALLHSDVGRKGPFGSQCGAKRPVGVARDLFSDRGVPFSNRPPSTRRLDMIRRWCSYERVNDFDIPWKRYRREKTAREDLPPLPSVARQDSSMRWRPADPSKVVPFPTIPQRPSTLEEEAEDMPL